MSVPTPPRVPAVHRVLRPSLSAGVARVFAGTARALILVAVAVGASSCASFQQDLHLAPLYSNLSMAGGGREVELVAGAVRTRRPTPNADVNQWALRPFIAKHIAPSGATDTRFIVPLGKRTTAGEDELTQMLPIVRYHRNVNAEGEHEWQFLMVPGILWHREPSGRVVRAVFPFGGVVENFLTYKRVVFALFPLYMKTQRGGRTSWHFPWPVLGYAREEGIKPSWRVWPLVGVSRTKHYDRRFFLWPIFQRHRDNLQAPPDERFEKWMVFPLFGHARRGSFRSWSLLWPFFGYAHDPEQDFWAFDGPWPLVRIRRGGNPGGHPDDDIERTRFWPFWSHYKGEGLESTWVLWPLMNKRHEVYPKGDRRSEFVVPFWQNWERFDEHGKSTASWTKMWPLAQRYEKSRREGDYSRTALPALNPLWHTPVIDDHYAWIYELYTLETSGDRSRERSWGGIWRRDVDSREERKYLSGLWSQRKYTWEGQRVRETSILLGLIRWRSRPGAAFRLLPPAVPGPGWPIERRPAPEQP